MKRLIAELHICQKSERGLTFIAGGFPGGANWWGETGDRCRDGWEQRERCYQSIIIDFRHLATWHLKLHNHKFHVWTMLEPGRPEPNPHPESCRKHESGLICFSQSTTCISEQTHFQVQTCPTVATPQLCSFRDVSELIFQISALQQVNVTPGATAPPGCGTAPFLFTSCEKQVVVNSCC